MLATQRVEARPRIANPRRAQSATDSRFAHQQKRRYAGLVRFSAVLAVVFGIVMGYVMLTANLTSLSYRLAAANAHRAKLVDQTARLEDRLASLRSDEHLAMVAAKLGMHPTTQIAILRLPSQPLAQRTKQFAFIADIARWFGPRSPAVR